MGLETRTENAVMGGAVGSFLLSTVGLLFAPTSAMATSASCCNTSTYHGCLNGSAFCVPSGACDPLGSGRCENEGDDNVCEWNTIWGSCS